MKPANPAILLVGILLLSIGAGGGLGLVPALAASAPPPTCPLLVLPGQSVALVGVGAVLGFNVTADTVTCLAPGVLFDNASVTWGDGTFTPILFPVLNPTHTYRSYATYTILYTATITFCPNGAPIINGVCHNPAPFNATAPLTTDLTATVRATVTQTPPPPATGSLTPSFSVVRDGLTVFLNDTSTVKGNDSVVSVRWSFGDATFGSGSHVTHSYPIAGNYTVVETVVDQYGATTTATATVTVASGTNQAPSPPATPLVSLHWSVSIGVLIFAGIAAILSGFVIPLTRVGWWGGVILTGAILGAILGAVVP